MRLIFIVFRINLCQDNHGFSLSWINNLLNTSYRPIQIDVFYSVFLFQFEIALHCEVSVVCDIELICQCVIVVDSIRQLYVLSVLLFVFLERSLASTFQDLVGTAETDVWHWSFWVHRLHYLYWNWLNLIKLHILHFLFRIVLFYCFRMAIH
jgi:hypothetical protein